MNWRVADWRIAGGRETAHWGRSGVCWSLLESSARHVVLNGHHLRAIASGGVVPCGHHGGRRHGDTGIWHRHGRGPADLLILDRVERQVAAVAHGSRVDWGG